MPNDTEVKRGWGAPKEARKPHYFIDRHSLCGRWIFTGPLHDFRTANDSFCFPCMKTLAALDVKTREGEQLLDELTLVIKTTLPCTADADIGERVEEMEALVTRVEILLDHFFGPGGHFHHDGYSITLERR